MWNKQSKQSPLVSLTVVLGVMLFLPAATLPVSIVAGGEPGHSADRAFAIAIDGTGNVYVTGESWGFGTGFDYATIKYDSAGKELWAARYTGPGNSADSAVAIAIDGAGNVYVTGESHDIRTEFDYTTVKYDADGKRIWVASYNGPGNDSDRAGAMALDGAGNIYVTGESGGSGTGPDYATVKYDPTGMEVWVARYNGPGNSYDRANAIAVDSVGSVYVTGWSDGAGTKSDYATVKYNPCGKELWVARYDGPDNSADGANAMALDSAGNVYVTGGSWHSTRSTSDYATVKYDPNGKEIWAARYDGPDNSVDGASAMAVDRAGSIYVTGGSYGLRTEYDCATIKYDADGKEIWIARYDDPGNSWDHPYAMSVDGAGNVYITGVCYGAPRTDYVTVKYDSGGRKLWDATYNGPGNSLDYARALAVDWTGSVYVTGWSYGSGTESDYATIKYDADGKVLWVARYNGSSDSK